KTTASNSIVIPGRSAGPDPESRDSGSGAYAPSRNDGHHIFSAGAAPPVTLSQSHAFEDREDSLLRRGAALPLGEPSRARSGRGGDARRVVAAAETAVPPQP